LKFCVIGPGFVGLAVGSTLSKHHSVVYVDRGDILYQDCDGYIICVPTPQREDGRCDSSLVIDYVSKIHRSKQVLIKSTTNLEALKAAVSINSNVTYSPEFLRGSVGSDPTSEFLNSKFAIYGGQGGRFWDHVFSQIIKYEQVRFLDIESAGFLKYTENSFLALKVVFFNEIFQLYKETVGVNYDAMIEALSLDERIGFSHTQVPGPDGKFGFGGHCFPKDTSEFVEYSRLHHTPLKLLERARELNDEFRKK